MKIITAPIVLMLVSFGLHASASITFVGEYKYRTDSESLDYLGDLVCFYPDEKSAKLAPRESISKRLVWFCFSPNMEARTELKVPEKQPGKCGFSANASVVVSNYQDKGGFMADTATLEKVITLGEHKEIPCN